MWAMASLLKLIDEIENVEKPKQGMAFSSTKELNMYCRSYAKKEGFGWYKRRLERMKKGMHITLV
jgi:hypothetical protein